MEPLIDDEEREDSPDTTGDCISEIAKALEDEPEDYRSKFVGDVDLPERE